MPCTVRLLPVPPPSAPFHDFEEFERLVEAARKRGQDACLVVLLGGEAGLRRGEITALEWGDVDLKKRQLCVQRAVWQGHTEAPKGGRLRYVPLTQRLTAALQAARHIRGPLVYCDRDGKPVSENIIGNHVDHSAPHVLLAPGDARRTRSGGPGLAGHADLRTTQRYMHLSPAALDAAIRLLELSSVRVSFGDTLKTATEPRTKSNRRTS